MIPETRNTPHQVSRQGWWGVRRSWFAALGPQARLGLAALVLAVLSGGIWCFVFWEPSALTDELQTGVSSGDSISDARSRGGHDGEMPSSENLVSRTVDGVLVPHGQERPDLLAVSVDNMYEARPQAGISKASVVIEAPVEGGITRFLAIYALDGEVPKIGPVRSARPYFVDWSSEYGAMFAHVGGSPEALELLSASPVRDVNEYFAGSDFWRSSDRSAPHNVYTSLEKMRNLKAKRFSGRDSSALSPWKFLRIAPPAATEPSPDIVIPWSAAIYEVVWKFDPSTGLYDRHQGGKPSMDDDGSVIRARNVLVQYAQVRILDEVGRRRVTTSGHGRAIVATAGRTVEAVWERKTPKDRTRFMVGDDEATLSPGVTWVEVVPSNMEVEH